MKLKTPFVIKIIEDNQKSSADKQGNITLQSNVSGAIVTINDDTLTISELISLKIAIDYLLIHREEIKDPIYQKALEEAAIRNKELNAENDCGDLGHRCNCK